MNSPRLVALALLVFWAAPLAAQDLILHFDDGRVTVRAQEISIRAILAEWARLGGTTIVNGEQVADAAVTLQLTDLPEREALAILLRDVSGYVLAVRRDRRRDQSTVDLLAILPKSSPPPSPLRAGTEPEQAKPSFFSRLLTGQLDAGENPQSQPPREDEPPTTADGLLGIRAAPTRK